MITSRTTPARGRPLRRRLAPILAAMLALTVLAAPAAADGWHHRGERSKLEPGNLLVSESTYAPADVTPGVTQLPPGCATAPIGACGTAVADGAFPFVFNNDSVDAFFGITSPVFLNELTPSGEHVATIRVPADQFVTSFSSKSELALNLSPEGRYVSFMGYVAKPAMLDVSNANTPGVVDPGNGDVGPYYRVVAQLDRGGHFTFTETNAYSGDNGRAAITNDEHGQDLIYAAGNAGQSKKPVDGVILGAGAQFITPSILPEAGQSPGQPTPLGSFNITELGLTATRPARTTTTAPSRSTTTSSTTPRAAAATGSTPCTSSIRPARRARTASGSPRRALSCRPRPLDYNLAVVETEGVSPPTCASSRASRRTWQHRRRCSRSACGSPTTTRCTSPMRAAATTPTRT